MKISLKLSEDSIQKAIDELNRYKRRVDRLPERLVKDLTDMGAEIAKQNVQHMGAYDTGELESSIYAEQNGAKGSVKTGAGHAAFVEFGTGVVGEGAPHPDVSLAGWKYDVNEHGELGWWYPGKDGRFHWTKGMPSRPYMYSAAQELRGLVYPTARELMKSD